ncbi:hypothetical protein DFH07DRAFT_775293 [Mycena maculata]|uniref:Uncharacterized protein n=1 Tax=Mycena maculata TaxID=230809 RepID=A0AAD7N7C2_9AGAR|nr:hypothetical protein DFH07DRAFT_775293 [Mycena maculata]
MTNTGNSAPPAGPGGPVINQPPPQRFRRTHTSAGVSNALKALPKSLKKKKNELMVERNGERGLLRAQHVADATAFPDDTSDDESTITVSDDKDFLSPASNLHKAIMASSPKTGKILLCAVQSHKRGREERQLCHSGPHINANAVTMDTRKVNGELGEKPFHVLNTVIFEKDVLKETEMDRAQWTEAALNFVGAIEGVESDIAKRWQAHFGHFSNAPDKQCNYPALLSADITLRQRYISLPFVYNCALYDDETRKGVTVIEVDEHVKELMASGAAAPDPVYTGGGGGGGAHGGTPPFQGGNNGTSTAVVCLVCARRSHLFKECMATTFSDGTVLRSSIAGGNILASGSGETLCRMWNTCGAAAACNHAPTLHTHACTFCNSKNHHEFSWTCRQNPPA